VTNRILEIDRGDLYGYAGNYSYYLEKKAQPKPRKSAPRKNMLGCCGGNWSG
jgi:ATP-binding cassette subfamily F protein uup